METFDQFLKKKAEANRLEISIVSYAEDGEPVSTVMRHRFKKNGRWELDADLDSGEQGGAREIPSQVRQLLAHFGLPQ